MNDRHRELHAILASVGHASRFRITLCLLEGERCVGELALAIGLSQSCTTRHVQALERAGVVRSRRNGKRVLVGIELARSGVGELLGWLASDGGAVLSGAEQAGSAAPVRAARPPSARQGPRSRPATDAPLTAVALPAEEGPPAGAPASGTHATLEEPPSPGLRRRYEAIEDFLL